MQFDFLYNCDFLEPCFWEPQLWQLQLVALGPNGPACFHRLIVVSLLSVHCCTGRLLFCFYLSTMFLFFTTTFSQRWQHNAVTIQKEPCFWEHWLWLLALGGSTQVCFSFEQVAALFLVVQVKHFYFLQSLACLQQWQPLFFHRLTIVSLLLSYIVAQSVWFFGAFFRNLPSILLQILFEVDIWEPWLWWLAWHGSAPFVFCFETGSFLFQLGKTFFAWVVLAFMQQIVFNRLIVVSLLLSFNCCTARLSVALFLLHCTYSFF